jgi:hypothetical protein
MRYYEGSAWIMYIQNWMLMDVSGMAALLFEEAARNVCCWNEVCAINPSRGTHEVGCVEIQAARFGLFYYWILMKDVIRWNTTRNNSVNSHSQDTSALQPTVLLTTVRRLKVITWVLLPAQPRSKSKLL